MLGVNGGFHTIRGKAKKKIMRIIKEKMLVNSSKGGFFLNQFKNRSEQRTTLNHTTHNTGPERVSSSLLVSSTSTRNNSSRYVTFLSLRVRRVQRTRLA